eukprot:3758668-Pyramimonas_sp.AAC.1
MGRGTTPCKSYGVMTPSPFRAMRFWRGGRGTTLRSSLGFQRLAQARPPWWGGRDTKPVKHWFPIPPSLKQGLLRRVGRARTSLNSMGFRSPPCAGGASLEGWDWRDMLYIVSVVDAFLAQ